MQATYFHLCPINLEVGSIIKPGNFGRVINKYPASGLNTLAFREMAFEIARLQNFPERPSRLSSLFMFSSARSAMTHIMKFGVAALLYEVEIIDPSLALFHGDMALIDNAQFPHEHTPAIPFMIQRGQEYWVGRTAIDESSEFLTASSVRVIREINSAVGLVHR